ncbi:hypothetical protein F0562_024712 [Nyssa sinensis]|uniref:Uncharacterized protein n=1 Tax=Nyssa sinensis TaxID=561372 RepID=A0A5J5BCF3_9ASTE|nr:hypothetical protein F0562_024712 [Nyssa sinensis]
MANFCCSIETEPRTLNQGQLNYAREAAVDIVQRKETSEALDIFIEGLKPVVTVKEMAKMALEGETVNKLVECNANGGITETSCQCLCNASAITESPDQAKLKEPLSAPF